MSSTIDQIIRKEDKPSKRLCSVISDYFFMYPVTVIDQSSIAVHSPHTKIKKIQDENGTYWYDYLRSNTIYEDVGWYGCSYNTIEIATRNYVDLVVSWMYVYAESKTVRYEKVPLSKTLEALEGENFVIPCRPTSPTAYVRLSWYNQDLKEHDLRFSFDPKFGFTLYKVKPHDRGFYKCKIAPDQEVAYRLIVQDVVGEFGVFSMQDTVVEGDEWELICAASIYNYSDIFDWSNEKGPIVQSDRISIDREKTEFAYRSILKIHDVKMNDSQQYNCAGKTAKNMSRSIDYRLEVKAARAPIITDTNLKNDDIIIDVNTEDSKKVNLKCFAVGVPKPSITWFKDGRQLVADNERYRFFNNFQKLKIEDPVKLDSGQYVCRVQNRIANVEVYRQITIKEEKRVLVGLIVLLIILAIIARQLCFSISRYICRGSFCDQRSP
ncbi:peroxidasin homolog isoform X1 [Megalopta genalis]|uniref:peroxidasin homolog isoform X1 n=1 Tax=Megalopta genalis TaxID=115081 RepID=UPI003FCF69E4